MKSNNVIIISGIVMIVVGVILFYSLENIPDLEPEMKVLKHGGTFVGLSGIGVFFAGILLTLTSRQQKPIQEDFEDMR